MQAPAAPHGASIAESDAAQYAYTQPAGYGLDQSYAEPSSANRRMIIIGAVIVLAICCAFACGLLVGFELIPDMLGIGSAATPKPTPRFTPTPQSLLPIIHYLIG